MVHRLGLEDIESNHFVAWAFDAAGIFGSGETQDEAVNQARARLGGEVEIVEEFKSKPGAGNYIINALFEDDLRLITTAEVSKAKSLLEKTLTGLARAFERRHGPRAVDTINHLSQAEWWYFDRLNLSSPREGLPEDPIERLRAIHERTIALLLELVDNEDIVEKSGEKWSARKVLRRTLWHRQDHLQQLEKA